MAVHPLCAGSGCGSSWRRAADLQDVQEDGSLNLFKV